MKIITVQHVTSQIMIFYHSYTNSKEILKFLNYYRVWSQRLVCLTLHSNVLLKLIYKRLK